jgi:protein gp37
LSANSKIEWTEQTWNPIVGCSIVSPGCTNCYAMKTSARNEAMGISRYDGTTRKVNGNVVWTGKLAQAPQETLFAPLRRNVPTTYFINSMGDLFHEDCPDEWILPVLDVVRRTSYDGGGNLGKIGRGFGQHTYQLLTKRSARMMAFMKRLRFDSVSGLYLSDDGKYPVILKNLWLGVSIEDKIRGESRAWHLANTPAAIRFWSCEPLLGDLGNLTYLRLRDTAEDGKPAVHWVIAGGESGPSARPMHPDWVRSIRDQCAAATVPFFFKQWGEWITFFDRDRDDPDWRDGPEVDNQMGRGATRWHNLAGGIGFHGDRVVAVRNVGKKNAGRLLDGIEHNAMPEAVR